MKGFKKNLGAWFGNSLEFETHQNTYELNHHCCTALRFGRVKVYI